MCHPQHVTKDINLIIAHLIIQSIIKVLENVLINLWWQAFAKDMSNCTPEGHFKMEQYSFCDDNNLQTVAPGGTLP